MLKKILVITWLVLLFGGITALFWYNEWIYHLPTPVPDHYKAVPAGQAISVALPKNLRAGKPVLLHFFNPDCPCSRFNINTFKQLVQQYKGSVDFVIVVMTRRQTNVNAIREKFDLKNIPVIFNGSIATACGVYSTPQAVLLDGRRRLYYRGNYNQSRYCTDEKTSYAKIAIEGLLHDQNRLAFSQLALRAYGCSLPGCKK